MEGYNEHDLFGLKRGEIRRVQLDDSPNMETDRLALILSIHHGNHNGEDVKWANVMYVHDDIRMATSVDLVLSPVSNTYHSAQPDCFVWQLVVQTDLYSTCAFDQIKEVLAVVGDHELECVNKVFRNEDPDSEHHWRGTSMGSTHEEAVADPRWKFKIDQGMWTKTAQSKSLSVLLD